MATVTGYTAAHIEELLDESFIEAEVVGDDLILTKRGGTPVNAGNVRGPIGNTGPSAASINDIGDVDTTGLDVGDTLVWDGTNWVPGINIKVQGTAPTSPDVGDLWVDTSA